MRVFAAGDEMVLKTQSQASDDPFVANEESNILFASVFLTLAGVVLAVLLYGYSYRKNHLDDDYQERLERSLLAYNEMLDADDVSARRLYLRGAEIDVLSRRISDESFRPHWYWNRLRFLNQHANRLQVAFSDTENWNQPTKLSDELGRIKRRTAQYRDRVTTLTEQLAGTDSCHGILARLLQIQTAIVNLQAVPADRHQSIFDDLLRQCVDLFDALNRLAPNVSQTEGGEEVVGLAHQQCTLVALWLIDQASDHRELEPVVGKSTQCLQTLTGSAGKVYLASQDIDTLVAMTKLTRSIKLNSPSTSVEQDRLTRQRFADFDRTFQYRPTDATDLFTLVMHLRYQVVGSNWQAISERFGKLQNRDLSVTRQVGEREIWFLRNDTAAMIWRCLANHAWLDRQDSKLAIENGLQLAFTLGYGSAETHRCMLAAGLRRSQAFSDGEAQGLFDDLPSISPRLADAFSASPSSRWSLTTAAIAAAIDDSPKAFLDLIANANLLGVDIGDPLTRLSLWRAFEVASRSAAETEVWLRVTKLSLHGWGDPNASTDSSPLRGSGTENLLLARSAWLSIAGQHDAALAVLENVDPVSGQTPAYWRIRNLISSAKEQ